eukprot:m.28348 g.28348  ORF g.28348 m.28348 type:complete len:381 (+) comp9461_c0_seq7:207-1349(+)
MCMCVYVRAGVNTCVVLPWFLIVLLINGHCCFCCSFQKVAVPNANRVVGSARSKNRIANRKLQCINDITMSVKDLHSASIFQIPHNHIPVVGARREKTAVIGERKGVNRVPMSLKDTHTLSRCDLPKTTRLVCRPRRHIRRIGMELRHIDIEKMTSKDTLSENLIGGEEASSAIVRRRHKVQTQWREGDVPNRVCVPSITDNIRERQQTPQPNCAVHGSREKKEIVGGERNTGHRRRMGTKNFHYGRGVLIEKLFDRCIRINILLINVFRFLHSLEFIACQCPDPDRGVAASTSNHFPISRKTQRRHFESVEECVHTTGRQCFATEVNPLLGIFDHLLLYFQKTRVHRGKRKSLCLVRGLWMIGNTTTLLWFIFFHPLLC